MNCARLMYGRATDLCDSTYPEKYLPQDLLLRLREHGDDTWMDEDDFVWGWKCITAEKDSRGKLRISVAGIYHGNGYCTTKYWVPDQNRYVNILK